MSSTGTQTSKAQETSEQPSNTQSGNSPANAKENTSPTQTGQSKTPQKSQGKTGQPLATSGQDKGVARRGGSAPAYFPSTAEFFSNPFGIMRRMHEEMDRAFAEAFGADGSSSDARGAWAPAIDVSERQGNLVVHAELPGVRQEDVHLEVDNDTLVLSGHRERSEEHEEQGVHRRERMFGSFYRAIPLPEGTDTDKTRAKFNDGVLEITVPLPPQRQSQSRRIPIGEHQS